MYNYALEQKALIKLLYPLIKDERFYSLAEITNKAQGRFPCLEFVNATVGHTLRIMGMNIKRRRPEGMEYFITPAVMYWWYFGRPFTDKMLNQFKTPQKLLHWQYSQARK